MLTEGSYTGGSTAFDEVYEKQLVADQTRKIFEPDWTNVIEVYMNYKRLGMPPGTEWMSDAVLPELFYGFESTLPNLVRSILASNRAFSVEAPSVVGERVQHRVFRMLDADKRRMRLGQRFVPHARVGRCTGNIILKTYWLEEYGEKLVPVFENGVSDYQGERKFVGHNIEQEVTYRGPWTDFSDVFRTWLSNERDRRGRPLWSIEEFPLSVEYMEEQNRQAKDMGAGPIYAPDVLNGYKTTYSFRPSRWSSGLSQNYLQQTPSYRPSTASLTADADDGMLHAGNLWCKQYWGRITSKQYTDTDKRLVLFGPDGRELRDIVMPTPNLRPPHRLVAPLQVGHEPYGRSTARWALDEINHMSQLRVVRLAEAWINALGGYIANRRVTWDQGDFTKTPGFVWYYDPGEEDVKPTDVIHQVAKNPVMPEMFAEIEDIAQRVRKVLGTDLNTQGQAYGARTSAYEAATINEKVGGRIDLEAALTTWSVLEETMLECFELHRAYDHQGTELPVEKGELSAPTVFSEELDFPIDIFVDAGEFGSFDRAALEGMKQMLGLFVGDPEFNMIIDKPKIVEDLFHRLGTPQSYVRDPEDVQRDKERAVQIQMAMAALGHSASQGSRGQGSVPSAA